jgi:hypothetical protein
MCRAQCRAHASVLTPQARKRNTALRPADPLNTDLTIQ